MKRNLSLLAVALMLALSADGSSIKNWVNGEGVSPGDLNANFNHVHTAAEALVTNAKVSASAAISHSKLATPSLLPRAWARMADCTATGSCTLTVDVGFSSATRSATAGEYTFVLDSARPDTTYMVMVSVEDSADARACRLTSITNTTTFVVNCHDLATPTAGNAGVSVVLYDDNGT